MSDTLTVPIPGLADTVIKRARVALGASRDRLRPEDKTFYVNKIAALPDLYDFAPTRIRELAATYPRGSGDMAVWAAYQAQLEDPKTTEAIEDWAKSLVRHVMRRDR